MGFQKYNKMVTQYNGPAAKLLTPPTLTLVKMTITNHNMVIQSTSPKISQSLMSTLAQVAKVTSPLFANWPQFYWFLCPKNPHCLIAEEGDVTSWSQHVWNQLVTHGNIYSNLATAGHIWNLTQWKQLVTPGNSWSHLTITGCTWQQLITPGNSWSHLATASHTWHQLVTPGNSW